MIVATTSVEKAKARRQETRGLIRIVRELDTRVLIVSGRHRLVAREVYYCDPIEKQGA